MGWPTGLLIDASTGTPTDANIAAGKMVIANTILAGNNKQINYTPSASAPTGWTADDATGYFTRADGGNTLVENASDVGLTSPFKYDEIDVNAGAGISGFL
jgi:hypothetical protein